MSLINFLIATANVHKLEEIRRMLPQGFELEGLREAGFHGDIPETGHTFEENALIKARFVHNLFGGNVIADDSGLEVEALNGKPGVFSARFAGPSATDEENYRKLLQEMDGVKNRKARFVAAIVLIINNEEHIFKGIASGLIATSPSGMKGFGYDPVFIPDGYSVCFAELTPLEKDQISHRGKALGELISFLNQNWQN